MIKKIQNPDIDGGQVQPEVRPGLTDQPWLEVGHRQHWEWIFIKFGRLELGEETVPAKGSENIFPINIYIVQNSCLYICQFLQSQYFSISWHSTHVSKSKGYIEFTHVYGFKNWLQ